MPARGTIPNTEVIAHFHGVNDTSKRTWWKVIDNSCEVNRYLLEINCWDRSSMQRWNWLNAFLWTPSHRHCSGQNLGYMLRFEGSHPTFDKKCPYWQNNISDTTKRSCYDWWYCSKCNCTYIIATPHQLRLKEKNAQHTDMYHRMFHNQIRKRHIWKR